MPSKIPNVFTSISPPTFRHTSLPSLLPPPPSSNLPNEMSPLHQNPQHQKQLHQQKPLQLPPNLCNAAKPTAWHWSAVWNLPGGKMPTICPPATRNCSPALPANPWPTSSKSARSFRSRFGRWPTKWPGSSGLCSTGRRISQCWHFPEISCCSFRRAASKVKVVGRGRGKNERNTYDFFL
jgi:hypothetical protein